MAFPTSPTDGQIYNDYKYSTSSSAWLKIAGSYITLDTEIVFSWTKTTTYVESVNPSLPVNAKAIYVSAFTNQPVAETSDHVHHLFGSDQITATASYSTNPITHSEENYGTFVLTHQGEGSDSASNYGMWQSGIINLNSSGMFNIRLCDGASGGTHSVILKIHGYYI